VNSSDAVHCLNMKPYACVLLNLAGMQHLWITLHMLHMTIAVHMVSVVTVIDGVYLSLLLYSVCPEKFTPPPEGFLEFFFNSREFLI